MKENYCKWECGRTVEYQGVARGDMEALFVCFFSELKQVGALSGSTFHSYNNVSLSCFLLFLHVFIYSCLEP